MNVYRRVITYVTHLVLTLGSILSPIVCALDREDLRQRPNAVLLSFCFDNDFADAASL
jgi:hypothetical protein